jgi:hypothetical protein
MDAAVADIGGGERELSGSKGRNDGKKRNA